MISVQYCKLNFKFKPRFNANGLPFWFSKLKLKKQSLIKILSFAVAAGMLFLFNSTAIYAQVEKPTHWVTTDNILSHSKTEQQALYKLSLNHQYPIKQPADLKPFINLVPSFQPQPLPLKPGLQIENSTFFNSAAKDLEGAVAQFNNQNWDAAKQQFQVLAKTDSDMTAQAKLWLGWLSWSADQNLNLAMQAALDAQQTEDQELKNEGVYLQAFLYFQQQQYENVFTLINEWQKDATLDSEHSIRFFHLQINSLVHRRNWSPALSSVQILLENMDDDHLLYPNWLEFSGLAWYYLQRFNSSQAVFAELLDEYPKHPLANYWQKQLVWLAFFQNQPFNIDAVPNGEEKTYLQLHVAYRQQNQDKVEQHLDNLNTSSIWYETAVIFLIEEQFLRPSKTQNLANHIFEQPILKTWAALYNGNERWQQAEYSSAEFHYRTALEHLKEKALWVCILNYQLGVTHLKQNAFKQAQTLFEPCTQDGLALYQLYFALYQQQNWAGVLGLQQPPTSKLSIEINLMIATALFEEQSKTEALQHLQKSFAAQPDTRILELAASLAQKAGIQNPLVAAKAPNNTSSLQSFKALENINHPQKALQYLTPQPKHPTELYWLTKWQILAVLNLKQLIQEGQKTPILNPSDYFLLAQNLYLAAAYAELNQLENSQNHYYKALQFSLYPEQQLTIKYNLFYLASANQKPSSTIAQGEELLAQIQPEEPQQKKLYFATVYWLAEAYNQIKNYERSLQLYHSTLATEHVDFLKLAQLKVLRLNQQYSKCQQHSLQPENNENYALLVEQNYLGGLCALDGLQPKWVLEQHTPLVEDADVYKDYLLRTNLSMAYAQLKNPEQQLSIVQPIQLNTLNPTKRKMVLLVLAAAYLNNQNPQKAQSSLGDTQNYRGNPEYLKALNLQAQIYAMQGQPKLQAQYLLRLYYHKNLPAAQKPLLNLKLSELMIKIKQPQQAKKLWLRIKPAALPETERLHYVELEQQINQELLNLD